MVDVIAEPIILEATGGELRIDGVPGAPPGWVRCTLVPTGGAARILGAENLGIIAARLVGGLGSDSPATSNVNGQPVWWVLSLAEAHHSLYAYRDGDNRMLLWRDANGHLLPEPLYLTEAQFHSWQARLAALATARVP